MIPVWWPTWYPDTLPKDTLPKDTLPKDILPNGHFADGHLVERTFCRTDTMTSGHKWYDHQSHVKLLWDFKIQTDPKIDHNKSKYSFDKE